MGALEIIRFAQLYPEEVQALVTIDGVSPQYAQSFKMGVGQKIGWAAMKGVNNVGLLNLLTKTGVMD